MKTNLGEVELVIFDWSGVISDDRRPVYEASMKVLERFGKARITYESWQKELKITLGRFLLGKGIWLDQKDINQVFLEAYEEVFEAGIRPEMYSEVPDILSMLRREGARLAVISAHPPLVLKREAETYGIKDHFAEMLGWSSARKTKSIFEVCQRLEVLTERAAYVGDMVMDIRSAKEAGVHSIAIAREDGKSYHGIDLLKMEWPEILGRSLKDVFGELGVGA